MNEPIELRYAVAKDTIVKAVNYAHSVLNVPFVFLDTLLDDISKQVANGAEKELKEIQESLARQAKEAEQSTEDTENKKDKETKKDKED